MDRKNHARLLKCFGTGCQREHVDQREGRKKKEKGSRRGRKERRKEQ
jgi:hypothetical protein